MTDLPDSVKEPLNNGTNHQNEMYQRSGDQEKFEKGENARLQNDLARLWRFFYALVAIVSSGTVILIIVIAVLYGKLSYDMLHHSHAPKVGEQISKILDREDEELCLSCESIKLGPSPEEDKMLDQFTRKDEPGGEKCCVETPKQLLSMLEQFIERRYREEMAKGNIKFQTSSESNDGESKPAAHLMGSREREKQQRSPGRQFPISNWIYNKDLAFTNHVSYRHGRIVVPSTGLYYVYSQVSFLEVLDFANKDVTKQSTTDSPSLSHYVYRYNIIYPYGGEENLVQNSITKCWGQYKSFGEYTSYLGAAFHLRQGDEIFVKVSNLTLLAVNPKSNYFGLFKL